VPKRSNFISTMVLGVREGNLYRTRGQSMHAMTNKRRETDEEGVGSFASGTGSKRAKVQRDSTLRIQWGGPSSLYYAEDGGQGAGIFRGYVDSEGV
jgi:hypothetical protein